MNGSCNLHKVVCKPISTWFDLISFAYGYKKSVGECPNSFWIWYRQTPSLKWTVTSHPRHICSSNNGMGRMHTIHTGTGALYPSSFSFEIGDFDSKEWSVGTLSWSLWLSKYHTKETLWSTRHYKDTQILLKTNKLSIKTSITQLFLIKMRIIILGIVSLVEKFIEYRIFVMV